MNARGGPSVVLRRLLGLLLVAVVLAFFVFTLAAYNKVFTPVVSVQVKTDKAGNQLLPLADVKVRGVRVGEVSRIKPDVDGAELRLEIEPEQAKMLPSNVKVRLLPKTLFGDRYVALVVPEQSSTAVLADGDRVYPDRSKRAVELDEALNNLMPVLQAVQPAKLSSTLNAVSTALRGRGGEVGDTLSQLGRYVGELNPEVPRLTRNLRELTKVSGTYSDIAPDLVRALGDLTVTSRTVAQQRQNLDELYASVVGTSRNLGGFLRDNQANLIRVGKQSLPTLRSLARYSPQLPCLLNGLADTVPRARKAFGEGTNEPGLHLSLEVVTNRGKYEPGVDDPRYEEDRGPRCYPAPAEGTPFPQYPGGPIADGSTSPPAARAETGSDLLEGSTGGAGNGGGANTAGASTAPQSAGSVLDGLTNSAPERDVIANLIGPHLGRQPADVPSWSSLLLGPLLRGTEVTYK